MPKFCILKAITIVNNAWNSIPDRIFLIVSINLAFLKSVSRRLLMMMMICHFGYQGRCGTTKDLQSDLKITEDKFDVDDDLTANHLVDIDLKVCVSGAVSDTDVIE